MDLLISENQSIKAQLEEIRIKLIKTESENKELIDRWMLEKMNSAEKLNEVFNHSIYMCQMFSYLNVFYRIFSRMS